MYLTFYFLLLSSNLSHAFNITIYLRPIIFIFCSPQETTLPHEPPAGSQGADAAQPGAHRPPRRGLKEIRPPATSPVLSRLSPFRVCRRRLSRCHCGGRRARRSREQTAIRGSAGAGEVAVEAWDVAVKTAPAEGSAETFKRGRKRSPMPSFALKIQTKKGRTGPVKWDSCAVHLVVHKMEYH